MAIPQLTIRSASGSSVDTRIELDGIDLTSKLVRLELAGQAGDLWRATLHMLCTIDVETRARLLALDAETKEADSEDERRRQIADAANTLRGALCTVPYASAAAYDADFRGLAALERKALRERVEV